MPQRRPILSLVVPFLATTSASALSAGRGFGALPPPPGGEAFASPDRFRARCPADVDAIRRFDPSLVGERAEGVAEGDIWVAVYRSANNLPSAFVRDNFFDAMRVATTAQRGDSETLVSPPPPSGVLVSDGSGDGSAKPLAVARLGRDASNDCHVIDSMRCALKKEDTDPDCDGGSEHVEAIGVCVDELVLSYLQQYMEGGGGDGDAEGCSMAFDGGIRFRGTLFSGPLLSSRGFREARSLSAGMHSHESDLDGALAGYAARSASREVAKSPGARDRALKIVSFLGRVDREGDRRRAKRRDGDGGGGGDDGEESDFDPWASVKRYL